MSTPYLSQSHLATLAFDITAAAFAIGELSQVWRVRRGATRADLRGELIFRVIFFAGILAMPAGRAFVPGATIGSAWLFAAGFVLGWLGLLLRWWSFATLGRYFTLVVKTSPDQPIIEGGPYRVLRHPSYTGLLLAITGCGLMVGNLVGAAGAIGLVGIGLIYRLQREERALTAALGARYPEFAAGRARLIPYVW